MVTSTESSSNHYSATSVPSSVESGECNSPKFRRKNLPSPWAQVVRGGDPESTTVFHQSQPQPPSSSSSLTTSAASVPDQPPSLDSSPKGVENCNSVAAAPDSSSDGNDGNAGRSKKPAWNKPSNGVVEAGPVMGAESWPALSESTKASGKLPPDSSSRTAADGSLSTSQGPVTSQSPRKQATTNAKPNSAMNYNMPNRQRSMKRGGGSSVGSSHAQSSFSNPPPPPPPPPFPVYQLPPVSYGNVVPGIPDPSPRDHYRSNNWDTRPSVGGFMPAMNEHRGSSRRGNFGNPPRGDGSYHNNYGSRRDQDRGNYANTRDAHVHQPRMPPPRGLLRHPPPNTAAFLGPQPIGPFANPIGFPEFYYFPTVTLEHFRGLPFFTHSPPPAMFFPAAESPLTNMIVKQIDYYFSDANLVKDEYLRTNMDEQGWVPITLIANFPRVRSLTSNIQLILDSLRASTVVEVQGDKLRRHNEWRIWLPSAQLRADSGSISPGGSRYNNIAADFQTITLEEATKDEGPTESSSQSQLPNGGDAAGNSN